MRKFRKQSFRELVSENKQELLSNKEALEKIETKLEERAQRKLG